MKGKLSDLLQTLASAIDRMSRREQVMVGALLGAFLLFVGSFLVLSALGEVEAGLAARREALDTLMRHKDAYLAQASATGRSSQQLEGNDLKLTPFIEGIAKGVGFAIENFDERRTPIGLKKGKGKAAPPRGGEAAKDVEARPELWEESLTVTIKGVTLEQITTFLDRIENAQKLAVIKKLYLKTLWSDRSKLDVTMTITTYKKT